MQTPPPLPARNQRSAITWTLSAFAVAALALTWVGFTLVGFYRSTASLAPGTEMRPMSVTLSLGLAGTASIVGGGICSLMGVSLSLKQRRWLLALSAVLALALSWAPWFVGSRGFDHVVELRKIILED
jgi:hypothetical protein